MPTTKEYTNGEVTIVWKADLCIHSKNCVNGLPEVFDIDKRPWINAQGATSEAILAQVAKCPSGALTAYRNADKKAEEESVVAPLSCQVVPNGPLLVSGALQIELSDGETVDRTKRTAFCRCGASKNKPFCDGSHSEAGFIG